jgi:hypothetical protein
MAMTSAENRSLHSNGSSQYFTVSDLRLPFSSPPTTRRITVKKFDPTSTRVYYFSRAEQSSSLLPATSQHGHSWHRAPLGPLAIYLFNVKTFVFSSFFRFIISAGLRSLLYIFGAAPTENTVFIVIAQQYLNCCVLIRCSGKLFIESLPSNKRLL